MKKLDDYLRAIEEARVAAEPWAVGKRVYMDTHTPKDIDSTLTIIAPSKGAPSAAYAELLERGARNLVPYDAPPAYPGVVAVIHPAAFTPAGNALCEALAKRFNKIVHIFQDQSRWCVIFVGDMPNFRSAKAQLEYEQDFAGEALPEHDDGGFYARSQYEYWAVVTPDGSWKNLAAS